MSGVVVLVCAALLGSGVPGWVGAARAGAVAAAAGRSGEPHGRRAGRPPEPDPVTLLDVVDAALLAGVSVPRALHAVGAAAGGPVGEAVARAGAALALGSSWEVAWAGAPDAALPLRDALGPSWTTGAAPGPALRVRAARERRDRRRHARTGAAALAVRLVLPLGLCFLPAFVLLGLAPLVLSLVGDLLG